MTTEQDIDKKFLIATDQIKQSVDETLPPMYLEYVFFWSNRLVFVENNDKHGDEFWNFTAFDILMNESRHVKFRKTDKKFYNAYPLLSNGLFNFIVEIADNFWRVNFVSLDWDKNEFIATEHIEKQCTCAFIIIDKMNPLNFIVEWRKENDINQYKYQLCKFLKRKFEFEEIQEFDDYFHSYFNDKLIRVGNSFPPDITTYDLTSKKEPETLKTYSSLLDESVVDWESSNVKFINDRMYAYVHFEDSQNYGIVWADFKNRHWNLMDFKISFKIWQIKFLNGNLIVFSRNEKQENGIHESEAKTYAIPMRRPNHLRYSAWILVVKIMKKRAEKDPYGKAKEYLPLNSDLRELWFKDEEKKNE